MDYWLLSSLVDSCDDGIISKDLDGIVTSWNKGAEQIFGYTASEIIGRSIALLLPEDRTLEETTFLEQLKQGQRIRGFETVRTHKDGHRIPVSVTISPLHNRSGKIVGASKIVRDITERKAGEEALREREQRIRATFDKAAVGIVEVDSTDRLVAVNDHVCSMLGYQREELLGQSVHDLTAPEDRALSDQLNSDLHRRKFETFSYEKRYLKRDGSRLWVHVAVSAIRDDQGRSLRHIGTIEDISERKRVEDELHRAHDRLERTVQERTCQLREMVAELETFSYSIAHDMHAPLRAMQGFAEAVLEDYGEKLEPQGKDYLERIKAAAARQDHFIRDVLNYSRLVRQDLRLESVDLDQLVQAVLSEYPNLEQAREQIEISFPLGVVLGHAPSLMQCLSNLIGNALKFVAPNTTPRVKVWSERNVGQLRLWVEDNGLGIARDQQPRLFRLFERLHRTSDYPGTGIGLAVVRKAVERMEGSVGVDSEPGKGSRFWVQLRVQA